MKHKLVFFAVLLTALIWVLPVAASESGDTVTAQSLPASTGSGFPAIGRWEGDDYGSTNLWSVNTSDGQMIAYCGQAEMESPGGALPVTEVRNDVYKAICLLNPYTNSRNYSSFAARYAGLIPEAYRQYGPDQTYAFLHFALSIANSGQRRTILDSDVEACTAFVATLRTILTDPSHDLHAAMTADLANYRLFMAKGNQGQQDLYWSEERARTKIILRKESADPALTSGNPSYSLAGAVYEVFTDSAMTQKAGTITTDENGNGSLGDLPAAVYYVKEKTASKGFELDPARYECNTASGDVTVISKEVPKTVCISLQKESALPDVTKENRNYSLGGAVYVICSDEAMTKEAGRITTDEGGSGMLTGLPFGNYYAKEVRASEGFLLDEKTYRIDAQRGDASFVSKEVPIRGGVKIGKWSLEVNERRAQGGATLSDTVFTIINDSKSPIRVDGKTVAPGEVAAEVKTDENGLYESAADFLPYGSYRVKETKAPDGYLFDEDATAGFSIRKDGEIVDLDQGEFSDAVIRGDLELTKIRDGNAKRMGLIPFRITSLSTGESHILVTDRNGEGKTASSFRLHSKETNANDAAVKDGRVDESLLNEEAGIWFCGTAEAGVAADDGRGALPYDRYTVEELRVEANGGLTLLSFEVEVYREGRTVHLGTVTDDPVRIATEAFDPQTGERKSAPKEEAALCDTIFYEGLKAGQCYRIETRLYDKTAGSLLADEEGKEKSWSAEFVPDEEKGRVTVEVAVDTSALADHDLVFFETLYRITEEGEEEEARHEDENDEAQTIRIRATPVPEEPTVTTTEITNTTTTSTSSEQSQRTTEKETVVTTETTERVTQPERPVIEAVPVTNTGTVTTAVPTVSQAQPVRTGDEAPLAALLASLLLSGCLFPILLRHRKKQP